MFVPCNCPWWRRFSWADCKETTLDTSYIASHITIYFLGFKINFISCSSYNATATLVLLLHFNINFLLTNVPTFDLQLQESFRNKLQMPTCLTSYKNYLWRIFIELMNIWIIIWESWIHGLTFNFPIDNLCWWK